MFQKFLAYLGSALDDDGRPTAAQPQGASGSINAAPPVRRLSKLSCQEWVPPAEADGYVGFYHDAIWALAGGAMAHVVTGNLHASGRVVITAAVATGILWTLRALQPVDYAGLLKSEAALLASIKGDVQHHWTSFSTREGSGQTSVQWHIHSLFMRPSGCAAEGKGLPPIVLVHGHSAGAAHWEAVFDRMQREFYVLDMPGWGRSPGPPELCSCTSPRRLTELHCNMLFGWLQQNGFSASHKVVLIGHSFGGFNVAHFVKRHPEMVEQVILVAPAGLVSTLSCPLVVTLNSLKDTTNGLQVTHIPERSRALCLYFNLFPPQRLARILGRLGLFLMKTLYPVVVPDENPLFPEYYFQLAAGTRRTGMGDRAASYFLRVSSQNGRLWWTYPCLSEIMAIKQRVSVIWGQTDDIVSPIYGPLLHRLRPHTDLYLIKDARHNPAHNNRKAFCDALTDCLAKHEGLPRNNFSSMDHGVARMQGTADCLLDHSAVANGNHQAIMPSKPSNDSSAGSTVTLHNNHILDGPAIVRHRLVSSLMTEQPTRLQRGSPTRFGRNGGADYRDHHNLSAPSTEGLELSDGYASGTSGYSSGSDWPDERPNPMRSSKRHAHFTQSTPTAVADILRSFPINNGSTSDGIPKGRIGCGRGYCNGCHFAVESHKSYWRCSCAAWAFNGHVSDAETRRHFQALVSFLDELYVLGAFNAMTSTCIVLKLDVKSPLPTLLPATSDSHEDMELQSERPQSGCYYDEHGRIRFRPLSAPFERGEVFLLE